MSNFILINKFKALITYDKSITDEVSSINIHRIYILALVLAPVHIAHVLIFWAQNPGEAGAGNVHKWHDWIIIAHAAMLIIVCVFGAIAYFIKRRQKATGKPAYILQVTVCLSYLVFGALVCAIDQLISSNITPYLVACIGIAVAVLIRPVDTLFFYAIAYAFFYYAVSWTQQDVELLLSVRVNGITTTGISLGVAILLWRNNVLAILQRREIEMQKIELEEKNKQLAFLANHDPLTGLYNRTQFMEFANKDIIKIRRSGKESCLILIDIDEFKKINDNFGHPVGDAVLKDMAKIITNFIRSSDIPARLGGEEFIVLLPDTELSTGVIVAERIRAAIDGHTFAHIVELPKITASFGVAALAVQAKEPFNTSYNAADQALYRAKKKGRNRVEAATNVVNPASAGA